MKNSSQNNYPINDFENESKLNFSEFFKTAIRKKKLVRNVTAFTFLTSTAFAFLIKPTWEGSFQIVLKDTANESTSSLGAAIINSQPGIRRLLGSQIENKLETEVKILESTSILKPIFEFVKEIEAESGGDISDLLYEDWKEDYLKVELETNTSVLNIKYQSKNKMTVIPVLEKLSNKYQEYSKRDRIRGIDKGLLYLDNQINFYTQKSSNSQELFDAFALEHNIFPIDSFNFESQKDIGLSSSSMLPGFRSTPLSSSPLGVNSSPLISSKELRLPSAPLIKTNLEKQRILASKMIEDAEYKIQEIDRLFNSESEKNISEKLYYITSTIPELNMQDLPYKLVTMETELMNLRKKFKEKDIAIQKAIKRRDFTTQILKDQAKAFLKAKISESKAIIEKSKRPEGIITKYKELYRRAIRDLSTLSRLEVQKTALGLEQARNEDPWELISTPSLLKNPVHPQKLSFIISGLLAGLVIGCLGAYYKEKISGIIYNRDTLIDLIPYPLLRIFSLRNENSWQDFVDLLIENKMFSEKNYQCAIIPTSKNYINDESEKLLNIFKKSASSKDLKLIVSCDPKEYKKANIQFLLAQTNLSTKFDLDELNESLNIQNLNVKGLIILDVT